MRSSTCTFVRRVLAARVVMLAATLAVAAGCGDESSSSTYPNAPTPDAAPINTIGAPPLVPAEVAKIPARPEAPVVADAGPALAAVPLLGGRLVAKLPPGTIQEAPLFVPGKNLGCTEYSTSIPSGPVGVTTAELGALTSGDLAAEAARDLELMRERMHSAKISWTIAPFDRATPPLKVVRATPGEPTTTICGNHGFDIPASVPVRYFVALADGTVQILDFSFDAESAQTAEAIVAFSEAVMGSLAPGPVALDRGARVHVLPGVPPGHDLAIAMPAERFVSMSEGMDSFSLALGRLMPLGGNLGSEIVVWSHSCAPDSMDENRARRTKATVHGFTVDLLRGRRDGRFFEEITFEDEESGACAYVTLLADEATALTALRASFDAGRLTAHGAPTGTGTSATATTERVGTTTLGAVYNGPRAPTSFSLDRPRLLVSLATYHWNDGRGRQPGTISLLAPDGSRLGPWPAQGRDGQGGVPSAYWDVRPGIVIGPGTFTVIDSDPASWSTNAEVGERGVFEAQLADLR